MGQWTWQFGNWRRGKAVSCVHILSSWTRPGGVACPHSCFAAVWFFFSFLFFTLLKCITVSQQGTMLLFPAPCSAASLVLFAWMLECWVLPHDRQRAWLLLLPCDDSGFLLFIDVSDGLCLLVMMRRSLGASAMLLRHLGPVSVELGHGWLLLWVRPPPRTGETP